MIFSNRRYLFYLKLFLIIIISILFIGWVLSLFLDNYIREKIKSQVEKITHEEYILQIGNVKTNLWLGNLDIEDISIKANGERIDAKLILFTTSLIRIEGLNVLNLFSNDKLLVGKLLVDTPVVELRNVKSTDTTKLKEEFTLYDLIKTRYKSLLIDEIIINNPDIKYFQEPEDTVAWLTSKSGKVRLVNFLVDSNNVKNTRLFKADSFELKLYGLNYTLKDSMYTFSSSNLSISYNDNRIEIDSFIVHPNYGKYEFGKKTGRQIDRFNLYCEKIIIYNADAKKLLEMQDFDINHLLIKKMHLHVFRDKHIQSVPENKLFIQSLLKHLPFNLNIDSISVHNSDVTYEERNASSSQPGKVSFNKIEAVILNVHNTIQQKNDSLIIRAAALLNDKGKININLVFPLIGDTESFYCSGALGKIQLEEMNTIMKNNAFLYFTDGMVDTLNFHFKAGKYYSRGKMLFKYHDLRIALKEKNENDTTGIKEKVKSFIANTFVLNKDNPANKQVAYPVNLLYQRRPDKFIFSYSWKTLLFGIKKTIGLPEKNR